MSGTVLALQKYKIKHIGTNYEYNYDYKFINVYLLHFLIFTYTLNIFSYIII